MPIFEIATKSFQTENVYNDYDYKMAEYNYQNTLEQLKNLSPDTPEYKHIQYKSLYYKEILDTHQFPVEMSYRNRGGYLQFTSMFFFIYILFAIVIVFSCLIITREYSSKNILPLFTSPSSRTRTYGAKFLIMSLFCLVSTALFFIILGLTSLKYNNDTGLLAVYFTNTIRFVSFPVAYTVAACMTLFASIMIGSITLFLASIIKNVYLTLPITLGSILTPIFMSFQQDTPSIFPLFNTNYSMYFYEVNSGGLGAIPNPPWAFFLINIVTIIIMGVLGCLVFSKRQVKE